MNESREKLLEVKNLKKYFPLKSSLFKKSNQAVKAVDDVSFHIYKGETFGLVGESGCGKSTLGRTLNRLYDPTAGEVIFDGMDIANLNSRELQPYRKRMQMIFQDPYSSLNPYMNVGEIIDEPLEIHTKLTKDERKEIIINILEKVGLKKEDMEKFPHEFSGGQRQRIGIARTLSINPEFIICDEAISALDVSIQAQVINMLEDLQSEMNLTYLFVAHDLSMVRHISDRIGVMYLGKMVEISKSDELYEKPLHPYTQALLSAIPIPDPIKAQNSKREIITGELPSPIEMEMGCRFRSRCPFAMPICSEADPLLKEVDGEHLVACHLY
ncbi:MULTISPECIES: ABC transporter ATP-binding protein [unclassified Bacillus (in: firmicutes)]|uniref:ABC transporter ATP-binding protein n=1 Tax=unclassified Bacillus (in: firmicutes) TaxID=185979 RepID=UPI0008E49D3E|nr:MULTISPECIES: oligopeptide/dipeptide ABC transporter ATP-binding protein [unclassified Bacillus (in: firmicutes)]SFB09323.1 oligopeptide transport system ATP-binding protein [Bacillus sp. UNCCL13]SFQ86761.1 oligopeptide transport system ATP-binding protein [Bacillus sp. cl95]